jgi:hypothetical protein
MRLLQLIKKMVGLPSVALALRPVDNSLAEVRLAINYQSAIGRRPSWKCVPSLASPRLGE